MNSLGYLVVLQPRRLPPTHKNGQMPYGARETLFSPGFCLDRFTHWLMTRCPRPFRALYLGAGRGKLDIKAFIKVSFCQVCSRKYDFLFLNLANVQLAVNRHRGRCNSGMICTAFSEIGTLHTGTLHDSEAALRVAILRWSPRILDRQRRQI